MLVLLMIIFGILILMKDVRRQSYSHGQAHDNFHLGESSKSTYDMHLMGFPALGSFKECIS